ncbi:hypothetical protein QCA50_003582 [Cerrena zonata]|uniref:N-acetyltransferase domain-containing protein n=1 Tax=Cerrena zonata TaxID=2478898 RepID=A0AAW0GWL6_9APHY
MSTFRVAELTPDAFVDAITEQDSTWTNWTLGTLLDSRTLDEQGDFRWLPKERFLTGVFKDNELIIILVKIEGDFTWIIAHPRHVSLSKNDTEHGLATLATSFPSILAQEATITPIILSKFDIVMGPASLVEPFVRAWISHVASRYDIHLKLSDYNLGLEVSYATLNTIPSPSSAFSPENHEIHRAREEHIQEIVPLYKKFREEATNSTASDEEALQFLRQALDSKHLWFVYYKDADYKNVPRTVSGFLSLGRETPRTIAIRNVFVSPTLRKKGIAEAFVRAITRFYLGAKPPGLDLEGTELIHPKDEICLNVNNPSAKRLYIRCGFQFGGDQMDSVTGKQRWHPTPVFGVEVAEKQ